MNLSRLTTLSMTRCMLLLWFLLCVLAFLGMGKLKLAADYTSYFSDDDQLFNHFQTFQKEFAQEDQLLVIVEAKQGTDVKQHMPFIGELTSALSLLPFIKQVGGFQEHHLDPLPNPLLLGHKKNPALAEFLAKDNSAVLLTLTFHPSDTVSTFLAELDRVEQLINEHIIAYDSGVTVYYSGELALNKQYVDVVRHDLIWFLPGLVLLLCIMLWLAVPEKWWIAGIGASSLLTLICTLGLAGWSHFTLAAISAFVPVIIIVLNVAYSMHIYFDWRHLCRDASENSSKHVAPQTLALNALIDSMQRNLKPLFWGSITTAFGFMLLRFSPSPPIKDFGAMVSFAVLLSFIGNYSVLIAFARLARYKPTSNARLAYFSEHLYQVSWRYRRPILVMVGCAAVLAIASLSQLRFDDDAANYFPSDNPFSVAKKVMDTKFSGINQVSFVVDAKTPLGITDPLYIKKMNQFSRFLAQQDEVIKVQNLRDWLKWFGVGQHQFKKLLTDNTAQALGVQQLINADSSASVVRASLIPMKASELIQFERKIVNYLAANELQPLISPPLSHQLVFAHLSRDNAFTMLSSFGAALLLLLVLLISLKRSLKLALLGLLTNVLPLVLVFGFWQLIGGSLSLGGAVVMGMILGIIIDDSLHLLLKVSDAQKDRGGATLTGFRFVMPAITFTSLLLVLGFSLGLNSDFFPIIELSFLSLSTIFIAWLFDFIVLPICYRMAIGGEC